MQHNNATQQCNTTMQHNNAKKNNKLNRDETLQLYKIGNFYNIYGDGAIILNYLFGYKN